MQNDIINLAREFSARLRNYLSAGEMEMVVTLNRLPHYIGACASHDYVDANCVMAEAFFSTYGREWNPASAEDTGAINSAWDIARAAEFDVSQIKES